MNATNNLSRSIELITQWLVGAIFIGFRFGSNFTLFFDRQTEANFERKSLPWQIQLDLLEDWWFSNEKEWVKKVAENGVGIEPDEPVKAFELAKLRWSEGAVITSVIADEKNLSLSFENGTVINVLLTEEDEFAYSLSENLERSSEYSWSVTLDGEGFHLKTS
jgi:hypothetical protein